MGCIFVAMGLFGQSDCIDLRDLYAPHIHCTWGTFENPYLYQGVAEGHHTVITDPLATDPRTQNQLQMVPSDERYSILLGDWTGGSAESISVDISVDTSQFDILMLKYAAVLEDPHHPPEEQPKFTFEILDVQNQPIDTACLSAVFVANPDLGWNISNYTALWKDWTLVGVFLSGFHGQTIRVRLTTYDCARSVHFGHAYFLLTCEKKSIDNVSCGDSGVFTFSAPDGFDYLWHWLDDPSQVLSTEQTVGVPANAHGVLQCHASFVGNGDCGFDMAIDMDTVSLENHYPLAGFSMVEADCPQTVHFVNESLVSLDGVNPDGTGNHCDDAFWDFGDGHTSTAASPTHRYTAAGDFAVTMVAGLNGFQCTDTLFRTVHVPEDARVDTVVCDAFEWEGAVYTESGVYSHGYVTATGCDSLVNLHLTVIDSDGYEQDTAACDRYVWNDSVYLLSGSYTQAFPAADRCDSIVTVHLDLNYTPAFRIRGEHHVIGGSEWEFTEHRYSVALDQQMCRVDSVTWGVDCPNMSILPSADGMEATLRVFTFLAPNDSVALKAAVHNRCGTVERTLWIHTTYYGVAEHGDGSRSLSVYPNPSTGLFTVALVGFGRHVSLSVYGPEGTEVLAREEDGLPDEAVLTMDGSRLRNGLYTLRVSDGTAVLTKRIVIGR